MGAMKQAVEMAGPWKDALRSRSLGGQRPPNLSFR